MISVHSRAAGLFGLVVLLSASVFLIEHRNGRFAASAQAADDPALKVEASVKEAATTKSKTPEVSVDESAIRKSAEAFSKAYNAGDAKAVAAHFAPNAEMIDTVGDIRAGRDTIEKAFAQLFENNPGRTIEIEILSLRMVAPGVATEDGRTIVRDAENNEIESGLYSVVHVRQDGKWLMASVRDIEEPAAAESPTTPAEHLEPLGWLVGEWVDEDPQSIVITTCRWVDASRTALLQEFQVHLRGRPAFQGTQRIGWDPVTRKIHSWVFDSAGGRMEGVWTWNQDHWIVKSAGVDGSGAAASATNLLTPLGGDRYRWTSLDRIVGDDVAENVDVIVVRKAPQPASSKTVGE